MEYSARIESGIWEIYRSLWWSITVYKEGKIEEGEYIWSSKLNRWRVINKSGFWEEYSIHDDTRIGIRKCVYPDGQVFINKLYHYDRGWNAIDEETYAIQNKSIPFRLEDN